MLIDKSNHGKVGDALMVKMTLCNFNKNLANKISVPNGTILSTEELNNGNYWIVTSVPIKIDEDTQGDYEVVCEHGVEIHNWNE